MNTEKLFNENETEALNKHGVMQGLVELSDEVLAEAFAILYGKVWKKYWPKKSKADEMRSIIRANDQPCRPFENWIRCIDFLRTQASPAVAMANSGLSCNACRLVVRWEKFKLKIAITDYRKEKNDRSGEPIQDGDLLDWIAQKFETGEFKQLDKPVVMQAKGRHCQQCDGIGRVVDDDFTGENIPCETCGGATVASEGLGEANKCVDAGCPQCKNTDIYDIDDHWTKCNNCGFTFVG